MQYLLLIYEDEALMADRAGTDPTFLADYGSFTKRIVESGEMNAGEALKPTSTATSVRVRNGDILLTDGPFAETREQLGGFYMVTADNLDRAIEIAAQIPSAKYGTIEVRPVMVWTPPG
jgi:hypothetical protein